MLTLSDCKIFYGKSKCVNSFVLMVIKCLCILILAKMTMIMMWLSTLPFFMTFGLIAEKHKSLFNQKLLYEVQKSTDIFCEDPLTV